VQYLDAVYSDVFGVVDRSLVKVRVLGFSQGATTACRWTTMGTARVDRLIVWGGEVPPDLDLTREPAAGRLRGSRLSLVYGSRDEYFTPKIVAATEARLHQHGIPYELFPFDGAHEIDAPILKKLALTADG
jgi:predicted esterase